MTDQVITDENLRLAESEERYRAVIDNSSDMIQSIRPDGTFEFVNQAWLDTLAYAADEVAALNIWDIVHSSSVDHCQTFFVQALTGAPIPYMEAIFVSKDGKPVPVEGSVTSRMMGSEVLATHGFFRDISEKIRGQELEERNLQLEREQQARYLEKMAALGKLSAGLAHELNNPTAAVQRAGSRLVESLTERDSAIREIISTGFDLDHWRVIDRLLDEVSAQASSGAFLNPIELDERETIVEEWLEAHDIGRAWNVAPSLVQAGLTSERLDQLAQDLPAPTLPTVICWLYETLTVQESADIIKRSSHRISELVDAVKGYSYMDRGSEQVVDIHDGLESTLIILAYPLRDVSVQREYDRNLPKIEVFGNTLNQVWTNILDNAIDATDGKGKITIRTREVDGNGIVEIEDNGGGISPEDLTCIFEPFFTTKPQGQGTGLGLDTVWRIITEEHGGTIDVTSEPGKTVFCVSIPLTHVKSE